MLNKRRKTTNKCYLILSFLNPKLLMSPFICGCRRRLGKYRGRHFVHLHHHQGKIKFVFKHFCPVFGQFFYIRRGSFKLLRYLTSLSYQISNKNIEKAKRSPTFCKHFVSKYGMLNAMFTVFESAKTRKSLGLQVYGRRVTRYGRSKSAYSPFQTAKQFANPATAG